MLLIEGEVALSSGLVPTAKVLASDPLPLFFSLLVRVTPQKLGGAHRAGGVRQHIQRPVFLHKKHSVEFISESSMPKKFITSVLIIQEPYRENIFLIL